MITETGIVTDANESVAWIKTKRNSTCKACANRDSCGGGKGLTMNLTVKNNLGVTKGDQVVIGLETNPMMFLAFLLYVFPILCLIAGALIGDYISGNLSLSPSFSALIFGSGSFISSFCFIRVLHGRLSKNDSYKPFLVKKKFISPGANRLS